METGLGILLVLGLGWIVCVDRFVALIARAYGYDA